MVCLHRNPCKNTAEQNGSQHSTHNLWCHVKTEIWDWSFSGYIGGEFNKASARQNPLYPQHKFSRAIASTRSFELASDVIVSAVLALMN